MHPPKDFDFSGLTATVVHPDKSDFDYFTDQGFHTVPELPNDRFDVVIVCCTRSKNQTRDYIARACISSNCVVVDGQKTDGIESHFKAVRKFVPIGGNITKAHGRLFWVDPQNKPELFQDWMASPGEVGQGLVTLPGVFSADGPDPASVLLADVLPIDSGPRVADFGAGWGFLSRAILNHDQVTHLDLVEANHIALTCAKSNISDPRAKFHWADVTQWVGHYDTVIMNPPFHQGRKGTPDLGQMFIRQAAASLTSRGCLWMVANRHLPYEDVLNETFRSIQEIDGTGAFKVFKACHPKGNRLIKRG